MMDRAELLALVAEGKDAWNEWVNANLDAKVDFSGVEFDHDVTFEGFRFPGMTDFNDATFKGTTSFSRATFASVANFNDAKFSYIDFSEALFSGGAAFREATFLDDVDFMKATFSSGADFYEATFSGYALFHEATFSSTAFFYTATFSKMADFHEATFSKMADFSEATFSSGADFNKATFSSVADFNNAIFSCYIGFSEATFSDITIFGWATFSGVANFSEAIFSDHANFSDINVESSVSFEDVEFHCIPDFSAPKNPERIELGTAEFALPVRSSRSSRSSRFNRFIYWVTGLCGSDRSTMIRIRQIRGIANKNHAVDTERDLTILERNAQVGAAWTTLVKPLRRIVNKVGATWTALVNSRRAANKIKAITISTEAETPPLDRNAQIGAIPELWNESKPLRQWFVNLSTTFLETLMLLAYRWSSRYGRSVIRPVIWLVGSFYSYRWLYGYLYDKVSPDYQEAKNVSDSLLDFTITSMVPFGSNVRPTYQIAVNNLFLPIEQTLLEGRVPAMFQFASLSQGVLTLIFVFLIGLALRNFFRMK